MADPARRVTQTIIEAEHLEDQPQRVTQVLVEAEHLEDQPQRATQVLVEVDIHPVGPSIPAPTPPVLDKLSGRAQVFVADYDGTVLSIIDEFETLEYTRTINGFGHHGWGTYTLRGAASKIPMEYFILDRLVVVHRKPPGGDWYKDFDGLNRRWGTELPRADDVLRFFSQGFDLRSLLKRRIIVPPVGQDFLTLSGTFTDVMREVVRRQMTTAEDAERNMPYFYVEPNKGEGPTPAEALNFRWTQLSEELEMYADGVGFDFDVVRYDDVYMFHIYYDSYGVDRRWDNPEGNNPVIFALENGNMHRVEFVRDRTREVTSAVALGDGIGATRERVRRYSLTDAQYHSPWNFVESLVEATQYTQTADLMAQADAYLAERKDVISLTFEALPTIGSLYGVDWDLGDRVTVHYDDVYYDFRIIEVRVLLDERGEHVYPRLVHWPDVIRPEEVAP